MYTHIRECRQVAVIDAWIYVNIYPHICICIYTYIHIYVYITHIRECRQVAKIDA